jgi:hypothetical protein
MNRAALARAEIRATASFLRHIVLSESTNLSFANGAEGGIASVPARADPAIASPSRTRVGSPQTRNIKQNKRAHCAIFSLEGLPHCRRIADGKSIFPAK